MLLNVSIMTTLRIIILGAATVVSWIVSKIIGMPTEGMSIVMLLSYLQALDMNAMMMVALLDVPMLLKHVKHLGMVTLICLHLMGSIGSPIQATLSNDLTW